VTLWAIPCEACGSWFALFEAEALPRRSDVVRWENFRDLHGENFDHAQRAACFSCRAYIDRMVTDPLDWVRLPAEQRSVSDF
jgi:hypothetical protein